MQDSIASGTVMRSHMLGDRTLSGVGLAMGSICLIQVGAALSEPLIREIGAGPVTWLRVSIAGLLLLAWVRPPVFRYSLAQWRAVVTLGIVQASMTLLFSLALPRIPLGLVVAIEFLGPLLVAAMGLRGWRAVVLPLLAFAGVVLLVGASNMSATDIIGIACAAGAGVGWGTYIVLTKRIGKMFAGLEGLAVPIAISGLATMPFGLAGLGTGLSLRDIGFCVGLAVLTPLIPYVFEFVSLRRLSQATFGILMSLEPAAAAVAGYLILAQALSLSQMIGIALVITASLAATLGEATASPV